MGDAASLFDLAAQISVDTAGSDRALTDTQKKVLDLSREFQRSEQAARKSAQTIQQQFGISSAIIQRQSKGASGGLNLVQERLNSLSRTAPADSPA